MTASETRLPVTREIASGAATTPSPAPRWSSSRLSEGQFAGLLTLPVIVVLMSIVGYPTLYSLWMSGHQIDLIFGTTDAVGLANYQPADQYQRQNCRQYRAEHQCNNQSVNLTLMFE